MKKVCVSFVLSLCLSCFSGIRAEKVIIKGKAAGYEKEAITLLTYSDYITFTEQILDDAIVLLDGTFTFEFDIDKTTFVFLHQGVYKLFMYAEPGKTYQVKLPTRVDKTAAEKVNPFFEEIEVFIDIAQNNITNLNFLIRSFNSDYNPVYNNFVGYRPADVDQAQLDTMLTDLQTVHNAVHNPYFNAYRTQQLALLRFMAYQMKSRAITETFLKNQKVMYYSPSYMELFNRVFDKYIVFFGRSAEGNAVYNNINIEKSYPGFKQTIMKEALLSNDTLAEMVVLKSIYDCFYTEGFSRPALLQVLDSLVVQSPYPFARKIGSNIKYKLTRLLPGFTPPDFALLDKDSMVRRLADFKGKYLYLTFCTTSNYSCIREYDLMSSLFNKFGDKIHFVTVSADEDIAVMQDFIKRSSYKWLFLHCGNQPSVLSQYEVRAFPTCYFINHKGVLELSPALPPSENVEMQIFQVLKKNGDIK